MTYRIHIGSQPINNWLSCTEESDKLRVANTKYGAETAKRRRLDENGLSTLSLKVSEGGGGGWLYEEAETQVRLVRRLWMLLEVGKKCLTWFCIRKKARKNREFM